MKKELVLGVLMVSLLLLAGCGQKQAGDSVYVSFFNESKNETNAPELVTIGDEKPVEQANTTQPVVTEPSTPVVTEPKKDIGEIPAGMIVKTFTEGDLVSLNVKTLDPDNDKLTITYSSPLDANGQWQTKEGDSGRYRVTITVSDGVSSSSKEVLLVIEAKNKPPVITIADQLTFNEGETIVLAPNVADPEGDNVKVTYSGWMDSNQYTTNFEDAGTYKVIITATDGYNTVSKEIKITIQNVNRAPVVYLADPIRAKEGDLVELKPTITDPDGDSTTISFSGTVGVDGKWQTKVGDAGNYQAKIIVSDGQLTTTRDANIIVEAVNRAPVIQRMQDITADEGDTLRISPTIIDPDGDNFSVIYSGWMTSSTYTTTYNDAGNYVVTVTATDSKGASSSEQVRITVRDKNRAPEIVDIE